MENCCVSERERERAACWGSMDSRTHGDSWFFFSSEGGGGSGGLFFSFLHGCSGKYFGLLRFILVAVNHPFRVTDGRVAPGCRAEILCHFGGFNAAVLYNRVLVLVFSAA